MATEESYNDYIEQKSRVFFRYLDRDHDGKLYRKDFIKRVNMMANMNVKNDEESKKTRDRWMRFTDLFFPTKQDEECMTEESFVDSQRTLWSTQNQKAELKATVDGICDVLFDRLDANRDEKISRDELKLYYKTIGSATEAFVDKVFKRLDADHDGQVTREEFTTACSEFWFSTDSSNGMEIMYQASV